MVEAGSIRDQDLGRHTFAIADEREQDVLGADVIKAAPRLAFPLRISRDNRQIAAKSSA